MGEVIGAIIAFIILTCLASEALKWLGKFLEFAIVNVISTILVVGGVILGFGFLAGEANAAMAIAIPASTMVAKMRLSTGGF